ncbi:hypothetical protein [Scopulibacillus cellulosilyticus]|uniref:Flagellar protein FliT n=1 Tax=Scopulibacillus cellulosilyticus TaxID=2665665 RepID=A0ABW2PYT0_9BACL
MSVVYELYKTTQQLDRHIENYQRNKQGRDKTILHIERLLDGRDNLISSMTGKYTKEEKVWGQEIVIINERINKGLVSILNDINHDRFQLKRKRQFSNKYQNMYQGISTDGVFLDKKE